MISQHQIVRLVEAREDAAAAQLIDRILANGRCRSTLARQTLTRSNALEVAALGLAIQRICEITYRPAPQSAALMARLLQLQRDDGTFRASPIGDDETILAATAVAIRALIAHQSQCAAFNMQLNAVVNHAIARGIDSLARAATNCLRDQLIIDPACWAIVLWQLGDIPDFRAHVPTEPLLDLLDQTGAQMIEDELTRYAHAMAA
jgi:hypothetical protein